MIVPTHHLDEIPRHRAVGAPRPLLDVRVVAAVDANTVLALRASVATALVSGGIALGVSLLLALPARARSAGARAAAPVTPIAAIGSGSS